MMIVYVLVLVGLLALLADHYSRLQKLGWAPPVEDYKRGRSLVDPIGSALGEVGRADGAYRAIAAALGAVGKGSELLYAPIGAALGGIGKGLELIFKPIGMVLGLVGGAKGG